MVWAPKHHEGKITPIPFSIFFLNIKHKHLSILKIEKVAF